MSEKYIPYYFYQKVRCPPEIYKSSKVQCHAGVEEIIENPEEEVVLIENSP